MSQGRSFRALVLDRIPNIRENFVTPDGEKERYQGDPGLCSGRGSSLARWAPGGQGGREQGWVGTGRRGEGRERGKGENRARGGRETREGRQRTIVCFRVVSYAVKRPYTRIKCSCCSKFKSQPGWVPKEACKGDSSHAAMALDWAPNLLDRRHAWY